MKLIKIIVLLVILLFSVTLSFADPMDHQPLRKEAQKAYADGNWKDAYTLFRKLCLEVENDPRKVGSDLTQAWQCLRQLNRLDELDAFREQVVEKHIRNWRLLQAAARSYIQNTHAGYMIAGEFQRGGHRGGGKYVNAIQRDRVRALQLMKQGLDLSVDETSKSEVAYFYLEFARFFRQYRGYHQAWRLQYLTDLSRLPDYEPGYGYEYDRRLQGAPVDAQGRPLMHQLPESFDDSASDGERWRYKGRFTSAPTAAQVRRDKDEYPIDAHGRRVPLNVVKEEKIPSLAARTELHRIGIGEPEHLDDPIKMLVTDGAAQAMVRVPDGREFETIQGSLP